LQLQTRKGEFRAADRADGDTPLVRVARNIEQPEAIAGDRNGRQRGRRIAGSPGAGASDDVLIGLMVRTGGVVALHVTNAATPASNSRPALAE
jgi:hypothetical protein